ncbi:MAG: OmpA family protein [Labilithrix sp.]|nr:OmpA family protein [Labilithrix sp.]MCW5810306.1 OmpA family protein [Labilithrix sp.]
MKKVAFIIAAPLLVLSMACGGDKKPEPVGPTATAPSATPTVTSAPSQTGNSAVNVDDAITKACNLKFSNEETAPKFDFDSESLSQAEKDILEQIAKCLTTGPLKGRAVDLVGRADPRGETEYNMTLGAKRARAAHNFLASAGVPNDKLHDTSRGELDATGTDEKGWQKDRRVDVKLRAN